MESRVKKQILFGAIFGVIFLIMVFGIYFFYFRVDPTCQDKIQNQKEEGIDCGAPCSKSCELVDLKNIDIQWVKALSTQGQNYDLIARVSNNNPNHGSRKISYKFLLYDINSNEIGSKSGASFILPRQDKYIIELKVSTAQKVAKIKLDIEPIQWEKVDNYIEPAISVFEKKYQLLNSGPPYSQASCLVKNTGQFDFKNVRLNFIILDNEGDAIGVNSSVIDILAAGQERFFSVPWHFEINNNAAKIEIEPEADIFE